MQNVACPFKGASPVLCSPLGPWRVEAPRCEGEGDGVEEGHLLTAIAGGSAMTVSLMCSIWYRKLSMQGSAVA